MDVKTAMIFKEQCMGTYAGHMADVPYNPVLHSICYTLVGDQYDPMDKDKSKAFADMLRDIAEALEQPHE